VRSRTGASSSLPNADQVSIFVAEFPAAPPLEPVPPVAAALFGDRLDLAARYARWLAEDGTVRGILGPEEGARIWTRHLLNSAAVTELFEPGTRIVDVGSGGGLPGLAIALRRPDVRVDLVEPLQRRVDFLTEVTADLGLDGQVQVVRGRAEEAETVRAVGRADWVTARAVAPIDRLVRWCLPLAAPIGRLALIKGASAAAELERHRAGLRRLGVRNADVVVCGLGVLEPAVTVVTIDASGTPKGRE
jgi:16S rRNA (guanine527-N7)-methyltransferase